MAGSETTAPLPQPETVAALPVTASTTARQPNPATTAPLPRSQATVTLPSGTVVTLPAGMIPIFPPKSLAAFGGVGQLIIRAAAGTRLPIAGAGTLAVAAKGGHFATAAFSATGVWEPGIYAREAVVGYTAAGTLVTTGKPGTRVSATGAGVLAAKTATTSKVLNSGVGGLGFTTNARAVVNFNGTGGLTMAATPFLAMGAYMTEVFNGWSNDSWTSIYPLLALPAYPGTALADSSGTKYGIVSGAGNGTIAAQVTYGSTRTDSQQIRIKRNGTVIATGVAVSTAAATATWTGALAAGDIITVEFFGDRRGSGDRWIDFGATKTYLTLNPA